MTTTHHAVLALACIILGSCVGSFLNVCIHRIPLGMSVLRPRSRCPRCRAAIRARHNVPVLGWLLLGGRCRVCRGTIPIIYPAVELGVGLLFAAPYLLAVGLLPGDPWERLGAVRMLGLLASCWVVAGLAVFMVGVRGKTRRILSALPTRGRRRAAGGSAGPASTVLRPRAGRD